MTITIPDDLREHAEKNAKRLGYATVEQYVLALIEYDSEEYDLSEQSSAGAFRTREEFEALIEEGANGPFVVADEAFWAERRRILEEKIAAKEQAARDRT